MRKDLEACVADFKDLIDKLDWAIAEEELSPLLVASYEISMGEMADRVREIAVEALRDQEVGE